MLQYGIRYLGFNIELGCAEQVKLKRNFTENFFRSGQILSCRMSMINFRKNDAELGKAPIYVVKFTVK
jgi:hypothetical protein